MSFLKYLALPASMGLAAQHAHAAQLVYEVTGASTTISFAIDEQPIVQSVFPDGFVIGGVLVVLNGVSQPRDVGFARGLSEGGFLILGTDINLVGPQLFTGTFNTPTLLTGNFGLAGFIDRTAQYSLQVSPAVTAVPEPSTWLLLVVSFGLLGGAMRSRTMIASLKTA